MVGEQCPEGNPAPTPASPKDQQNWGMQDILPFMSAVVEQDQHEPLVR